METASQPYVQVYQLLDDVCFSSSPPAGSRGAIFSAIDRLRLSGAPAEHVRIAEQIAVALHRLESAVRAADSSAREVALEKLQCLAVAWHQTPLVLTRH